MATMVSTSLIILKHHFHTYTGKQGPHSFCLSIRVWLSVAHLFIHAHDKLHAIPPQKLCLHIDDAVAVQTGRNGVYHSDKIHRCNVGFIGQWPITNHKLQISISTPLRVCVFLYFKIDE